MTAAIGVLVARTNDCAVTPAVGRKKTIVLQDIELSEPLKVYLTISVDRTWVHKTKVTSNGTWHFSKPLQLETACPSSEIMFSLYDSKDEHIGDTVGSCETFLSNNGNVHRVRASAETTMTMQVNMSAEDSTRNITRARRGTFSGSRLVERATGRFSGCLGQILRPLEGMSSASSGERFDLSASSVHQLQSSDSEETDSLDSLETDEETLDSVASVVSTTPSRLTAPRDYVSNHSQRSLSVPSERVPTRPPNAISHTHSIVTTCAPRACLKSDIPGYGEEAGPSGSRTLCVETDGPLAVADVHLPPSTPLTPLPGYGDGHELHQVAEEEGNLTLDETDVVEAPTNPFFFPSLRTGS